MGTTTVELPALTHYPLGSQSFPVVSFFPHFTYKNPYSSPCIFLNFNNGRSLVWESSIFKITVRPFLCLCCVQSEMEPQNSRENTVLSPRTLCSLMPYQKQEVIPATGYNSITTKNWFEIFWPVVINTHISFDQSESKDVVDVSVLWFSHLQLKFGLFFSPRQHITH